jgi:osmotically-inducible protein OsmY
LRGSHRGRGPAGYRRADSRITEDINDVLLVDDGVDARGIRVRVEGGLVTLSGTVETRAQKRAAEALVDSVPGVADVKNELRLGQPTVSSRDALRAQGDARRPD